MVVLAGPGGLAMGCGGWGRGGVPREKVSAGNRSRPPPREAAGESCLLLPAPGRMQRRPSASAAAGLARTSAESGVVRPRVVVLRRGHRFGEGRLALHLRLRLFQPVEALVQPLLRLLHVLD